MHEVLFRESRFRYPRAPSEGPLGSRPDTHSQARLRGVGQLTQSAHTNTVQVWPAHAVEYSCTLEASRARGGLSLRAIPLHMIRDYPLLSSSHFWATIYPHSPPIFTLKKVRNIGGGVFVRAPPPATTSRERACVGQTGRFAVGRYSTWCRASAAPPATADREKVCVGQTGRFAVGRCSAS